MKIKKETICANLANALSLINVGLGTLSILLSIKGLFSWSIFMIAMAALADRYDGAVARHFNSSSELGLHLDSLCDIVSFGIAPAILSYSLAIKPLENIALQILFSSFLIFYVLAGVYRLARYNVSTGDSGYFEGLPITMAGSLLAFLVLLKKSLPIIVYPVAMLILAFLMVSKIKLKKR